MRAESTARVRVFDARAGRLLYVLAPKSRVSGSSSRVSLSRRTTACWQRRASWGRTSGTPAAAGSSVRPQPRRQSWRREGRGLQPRRQPARRRWTGRRWLGSRTWRKKGGLGRLPGVTNRSVNTLAWSPAGRPPGGWQRRPDRARAVGERRRPGRPAWSAISPATDQLSVGGRLEPERTLTAQREQGTAPHELWDTQFELFQELLPLGGAKRRRGIGGLVRPGRAAHRLGRDRRHRPGSGAFEDGRHLPARSFARAGKVKKAEFSPERPPGRDCQLGRPGHVSGALRQAPVSERCRWAPGCTSPGSARMGRSS